jgi:hypothetical protein
MRRRIWLAVVVSMFVMAGHTAAESSIDGTNRWAWAANSGWVNCQADITNGAVIGEYICSGYLWSEGTGWIHLGDGNPTNGIQYTNNGTNDYGVNHNGAGELRGYAWCESAGWIAFETNGAPRVDLQNGYITGHAWGGSLGWVSFSNVLAHTETSYITNGVDGDSDGIADAWELTYVGSTNTLGGTNDWDGDGVSDADEYVADTSPTNANSFFGVSGVSITNGTNICFSWTWEPSRGYKVQELDDLTNHPGGWVDSSLGLMYSQDSSNVTVCLPVSSTQRFYRAIAVKPLSL